MTFFGAGNSSMLAKESLEKNKSDDVKFNRLNCYVQMGIIYKITSPSGKSYIGQTQRSLKVRIVQHTGRGSSCSILKAAITKYGWQNMKTEILLECDNEHLPMYERHFIQAYDTFGPHGYNATSGGEVGKTFATVVRQRISSRLRDGWANGSITPSDK